MKPKKKNLSLEDVENFVRFQTNTKDIVKWRDRSNFEWEHKKLAIEDGQVLFLIKCQIILKRHRQREHVKHRSKWTFKSPFLALRKRLEVCKNCRTILLVFIPDTVVDYCRSCEVCQKYGDFKSKSKSETDNLATLTMAMKQIGVDFCILPEVDGSY